MKRLTSCGLTACLVLGGTSATAVAAELPVIGTGPMATGGTFELRAGMGRQPGNPDRDLSRCAEVRVRGEEDDRDCHLELGTRETAQFRGSSGYCLRHEALYWALIAKRVGSIDAVLENRTVVRAQRFAGPEGWPFDFAVLPVHTLKPIERVDVRDMAGKLIERRYLPFGDEGACGGQPPPLTPRFRLARVRMPSGAVLRISAFRRLAREGRHRMSMLCIAHSFRLPDGDLGSSSSSGEDCVRHGPTRDPVDLSFSTDCDTGDAIAQGLAKRRVGAVRVEWQDGSSAWARLVTLPAQLHAHSRYWLAVAHSKRMPVALDVYDRAGRRILHDRDRYPSKLSCRRGGVLFGGESRVEHASQP